MPDLYICSCGNQTWEILESGVRCVTCKTEFPAQHTPVREFNHLVSQSVQEALEEELEPKP